MRPSSPRARRLLVDRVRVRGQRRAQGGVQLQGSALEHGQLGRDGAAGHALAPAPLVRGEERARYVKRILAPLGINVQRHQNNHA